MIKYAIYKKLGLHIQKLDNVLLFLLQRKDLNSKVLCKRILECELTCICTEANRIIGVGMIKKASKKALNILNIENKEERARYKELGFFNVNTKHRNKGIGTQIQKKLLSKIHEKEIIGITRFSNIGSQKMIQKAGFIDTGKGFFSEFINEEMKIFILKK